MKNIKGLKALLLAVLMVLSVALFAACGSGGGAGSQVNEGNKETESSDAAYRVSVVDALGNPYTKDIAVKFLQDGKQVAMQLINESGVAEKTMIRGDYTVELQFTGTDAQYYYDVSGLTLSAEKTELEVVVSLMLGEDFYPLFVDEQSHDAYYVAAGCTQVALTQEGRNYFIFAPKQSGTYEFSLVGSDAALGYYGGTHFVQKTSAVDVVDNKFQLSVSEGNLGSTYVIGIDAGEGDAVLCISRIGDAQWTIEQEPWTVYKPTVEITPYTLPAGTKLNKFDLKATTDTYNLVLNEADGFYHLDSADGALVLVQIGITEAETDYLPPFEKIMEDSSVRRYFFDENGEFVKKEEYYECLQQYIDNCDENSGLYPLTEDLKYIINQAGIQAGWWDVEGHGYLFVDNEGMKIPGINSEIAWLFMCRYAG